MRSHILDTFVRWRDAGPPTDGTLGRDAAQKNNGLPNTDRKFPLEFAWGGGVVGANLGQPEFMEDHLLHY